MWRALGILLLACAIVHAEPGKSRIVLADPDPALRAAVERTLSPWRIEVVVERTVPTSRAKADDLARSRDAHFVVWREGGELVVLDRRRKSMDHREARVGSLDAIDAAAAALTVKTLMRLEPPPALATTTPVATPPAPPPATTTPPATTAPATTAPATTAPAATTPAPPATAAPEMTPARPPVVAQATQPAPLDVPSPEAPDGPVDDPPAPRTSPASAPELVVQLGFGTRVAAGTEVGMRGIATVLAQPWTIPLRFGITGDLGTSTDVKVGSFRGTWGEWSLVATASYAIAISRWELEPFVGAGVARSRLSGIEMSNPRDETATLATLRAGTWVRWRTGRWSVGGVLSGDVTPASPTYTSASGMSGNPRTTFVVPSVGLTVGAFASIAFGR